MQRTNRFALTLFLLLLSSKLPLLSQSERAFSIPLEQLKTWSDHIVSSIDVEILGNSKVHPVANDCEMHFGATMPGFRGDPAGIVLEPMNLCIEPFPGKSAQSNKDWETFGRKLRGERIRADGVPRIWPEHLIGGSDSNPDHAVEIHPMTKLQHGNDVIEFSQFIFAPDGFSGGVGEATAKKIITETEVSVTENDGLVEINFQAGRIGNFTTLEVSFNTNDIEEIDGGHRIKGQVNFDQGEKGQVHLVTVMGSDIDSTIAKLRNGRRNQRITFDALVLFSLSPEAIFKAVKDSHGRHVSVENPLQLIIFGQIDEDAQRTQ